jgi:hypothetical protein
MAEAFLIFDLGDYGLTADERAALEAALDREPEVPLPGSVRAKLRPFLDRRGFDKHRPVLVSRAGDTLRLRQP